VRPQDAGSIKHALSSSGGGGSEKTEPWVNSFDKFYNTYEKINTTIRQRERLEKKYTQALNKTNTTADELIENTKEQLELLQEEAKL
jgi:hypothetical protein